MAALRACLVHSLTQCFATLQTSLSLLNRLHSWDIHFGIEFLIFSVADSRGLRRLVGCLH